MSPVRRCRKAALRSLSTTSVVCPVVRRQARYPGNTTAGDDPPNEYFRRVSKVSRRRVFRSGQRLFSIGGDGPGYSVCHLRRQEFLAGRPEKRDRRSARRWACGDLAYEFAGADGTIVPERPSSVPLLTRPVTPGAIVAAGTDHGDLEDGVVVLVTVL
jgi:hypothetical protein